MVFTEILELIVKINSEKQISLLNKVSPKFLIAKVIFEKIFRKFMTPEDLKKEQEEDKMDID